MVLPPSGQPQQDLSQVPSALATSMTKDKKPFTYLPGGLDFSEIRSPSMAKRLAKHQATIIKVRLLGISCKKYNLR